jgi:hypothetical protein
MLRRIAQRISRAGSTTGWRWRCGGLVRTVRYRSSLPVSMVVQLEAADVVALVSGESTQAD